MSVSKKKVVFEFTTTEKGRVSVHLGGDQPNTAETWTLWMMVMRALIKSPDLPPSNQKVVRDVYNLVGPGIDDYSQETPGGPLRILVVYTEPDERFKVVEFKSGASGPIQTGWVRSGTYEEVITRMEETFGILERIPRASDDAPEIYESWI